MGDELAALGAFLLGLLLASPLPDGRAIGVTFLVNAGTPRTGRPFLCRSGNSE